ncbi:unnamed protein product, partial [marine sediment metagenome]
GYLVLTKQSKHVFAKINAQDLTWQESVDNAGRPVVRYDGVLELNDKREIVFTPETIGESSFGFGDDIGMAKISERGLTYIYDENVEDKKGDLFKAFDLVPFEDGRLVDDKGRTKMKANNFKQHLRWFLLKDNRGRDLTRWDGALGINTGKFELETITDLNSYSGIPGKIGIPTTSTLSVTDLKGNAQGQPISNSDLLDKQGNCVDINDTDIAKLFDYRGRIRYQADDYIRYKGQTALRQKQEYKDGHGLLEERHFGRGRKVISSMR